MIKKHLVLLACLTFSMLNNLVIANAIDGNPEKGKQLAYTCGGCHSIPGYVNTYPTYHVPKLAGQNAEYIIIALKAYQSGERPHKTMQAQAATLSEQDMKDIAIYFANQGKN